MESADNKAVVEFFDSNSVWGVSCIQYFQSKFHIGTSNLQNICFCVSLSLDKPEHLDLVGKYKQIPTDEIDTVDVCEKSHKDINEGLHYFKLVPKKDGKYV